MSGKGLLLAGMAVFALVACTANGDPVESSPTYHRDGPSNTDNNPDSKTPSSSSTEPSDSTEYSLDDFVEMSNVPAITFSRGTVDYKVSAFSIGKTEVTQGLYREIVGSISKDDALGDDYPVFNVSWYDAARFCNALSKKVGLDTAYVYESINSGGELENLSVNYAVKSVRLPTEMEWEIAARAGTSTTYYWDTDVASKYAYYAQDKGPVAVAGFTPNELDLYDMAGNVAEWVNDWYGAYPTVSQDNYTGPAEGTYKGIRGGGWSDKAPALASAERDKKDPKYHSQTIGFRIVYSKGF
jgi:formylglycine-generating enzyme required for sulfatase activity